ncbi:MAG: hypothetical protein QM605_08700 [Sphingobium sp.]
MADAHLYAAKADGRYRWVLEGTSASHQLHLFATGLTNVAAARGECRLATADM